MKIRFLFYLFLLPTVLYAQKNSHPHIRHKHKGTDLLEDSLKLYKKIESLSKKRKITYKIYQSVFKYNTPVKDTSYVQRPLTSKRKRQAAKTPKKKLLRDYEGAIIRKVTIISLDPGGYNITDTATKPTNFSEKAVNFFHIKSRKFAIRNHLLFSAEDSLDPLKIKESERILRTSNYIHDAVITVTPINKKGDSVDVLVLTQDKWSIVPSGSYGSEISATVRDNNILGSGQQYQQTVATRGLIDSAYYYKGNYSIPYIRHTFITASGFYSTDPINTNKGIMLNRSFYSSLTTWAGGAQYSNFKTPSFIRITYKDSIPSLYKLDYNYLDLWHGWSFALSKSKKEKDRTLRLITTARYYNRLYFTTLPIYRDPMYQFQSVDTWFMSIGLSKREFYKDRFIYRFGATEDVPTGFLFSLTGGYQKRRQGNERTYMGLSAAWSGGVRSLYMSTFVESGSFFNEGKPEQGLIRANVSTFTDIMYLHKWKLRQFLVVEGTYGYNRGPNEIITINNESGLRGFNSPLLWGTNKLLVYIQSQFYAPFTWAGFSFAPIVYAGMGMLGNQEMLAIKNQPYPFVAIGMQVRNELLVFNTFQFTIGYYPHVPGTGSNIIKFNPIRTDNIQFRQLSMGEPGEVPFY